MSSPTSAQSNSSLQGSFAVSSEGVKAATAFLEESLEKLGLNMMFFPKFAVPADEILSNIMYYSKSQALTIQISHLDGGPEWKITYTDSGIPYNPLERPDPDVARPASERQAGGLGIFIVKKMTNSIDYQRIDEKNVLELTYKIPVLPL